MIFKQLRKGSKWLPGLASPPLRLSERVPSSGHGVGVSTAIEVIVPFLAPSKAIGEASFLPGQFPEFVLMYLYSS
jgi:hypothetical protein